jgi:arylsulfatase A-like enzyme
MDRRKFIGLMGSGIVASNSLSMMSSANDQITSGHRPNFLFIICDDLMFRTIHSLNNPEIHTPNMDRLAASGCAFTHCFHQGSWSGAVCLPSRTMLNSGLTAFHAWAGIDHVSTWGQTLGNAGYDTYICGKWHLDTTVLQRSFKEMGPIGPGMLPSTLEGGAAYGRPRPGDSWQPWDKSLKGHWIHTQLWANQTPDTIEHSCVLYSDIFIDHLLNKAAKQDNPFFMYLGFNSPHDPRQSPRKYLDMYPQEKLQVPPNFLPQHPFELGDYFIRDEVLAPFPRTPDAIRLHRREYYALITYMDEQIGRVLDALQQTGKAHDTYVILTADHGLAVGEHGLMGKQNLYDCSVRMPLIIAGPGITAGRRVDDLVYQHCLYATTCDLAGIPIPHTVEFPSIAPLLRNESQPIYEEVFSYYKNFQRMVRTKTKKLIVYPQIRRMQLFDLESDPWEMHDLSNDPAMAEVKTDLMRRLRVLQQQLDDKLDMEHPTYEGDETMRFAPNYTGYDWMKTS